MFDIMDPYNYTVLGMAVEAIEDDIDILRKRSYEEPVSRADVHSLFEKYGIGGIGELPTYIRWKVGEIEVCD